MSAASAGRLEVALAQDGPIRLDAQFDCAPGELVALVGPSGSGKTSLLRAVAGLLRSRSLRGRISVGPQPWFDSERGINLSPQQRHAGLVFQHYALFPHLSALANVAIAAGPAQSPALVQALFQRLGLAGLEQRRPAQLSGGQQQRASRRCCCWTNPFRRSTRRRARRCTVNWPNCARACRRLSCW